MSWKTSNTVIQTEELHLCRYFVGWLSEGSRLIRPHLAKTLHGISVIRVYGSEIEIIGKFDHLQNVHTAPCFVFNCG